MPCVLHVLGKHFDPDAFLLTASFEPYAVFQEGTLMFLNNPKKKQVHKASGFKCDVSSSDGNLAMQVKEAIAFLKKHHDDLLRLASLRDVESRTLDFGYFNRLDGEQVVVQCDSLPAELLILVGALPMGIDLTLYPLPSVP